MKYFLTLLSTVLLLAGCAHKASVSSEPFGKLSTGEEVTMWHLVNNNGASMDVIDFGCRIVKICMPDRDREEHTSEPSHAT